jgi:hypothetical protein
MDEQLQTIFLHEIERQSQFGLMAAGDLERALAARDGERLWSSIQGLLIAVGNISKLLWPIAAHEERGRRLRQVLGVPDDSGLFEHFDGRLEGWATSSERRNFVESNIGPPRMIVGIDPGDSLRNLDTQDFALTFRGDKYEYALGAQRGLGVYWKRSSGADHAGQQFRCAQ